jgi:hypothetical protein
MSPYDDDDDWVGTPPEGHYSRDRAKPSFWREQQRFLTVSGAVTGILVIAIVLILVLR